MNVYMELRVSTVQDTLFTDLSSHSEMKERTSVESSTIWGWKVERKEKPLETRG